MPAIETAAQSETRFSRTDNPLIYPLDVYMHFRSSLAHFTSIVNDVIEQHGGGPPIGIPFIDPVEIGRASTIRNNQSTFVALQIPLESFETGFFENLYGLLKNHFWTVSPSTGSLPPSSRTETLYLSPYSRLPNGDKYKNPEQVTGFLIRKSAPDLNLEIRYNYAGPLSTPSSQNRFGYLAFSEVEFGYLAAVASFLIAGKIDLSSDQGFAESLDLRRTIFMDIYQTMLREYQPPVVREEICGLDEQIADMEQNLYNPLVNKRGNPMNTLLVGAPGEGKTFVSRFFATRRDVLTAPVGINELINDFERYVLPTIKRMVGELDLPAILAVEDVEKLLESAISVGVDGESSQMIDPAERSKVLSLLERLQDTHGIYLMATLNHPDVEAAFLRRFNPVYFPFPSTEHREDMLRKIIAQEPLDKDSYNAFVRQLVADTEGFNYSGLSLIPQYADNLLLGRDGNLSAEEYLDILRQALKKVQQRTSLQNLANFDQAARKMLGLT
ncbi:MAG: hypothetical protein AAB414_05290 [Patescibacteria group bacterium]